MKTQVFQCRNIKVMDGGVLLQRPLPAREAVSVHRFLSKVQRILSSETRLELRAWMKDCRYILTIFSLLFKQKKRIKMGMHNIYE